MSIDLTLSTSVKFLISIGDGHFRESTLLSDSWVRRIRVLPRGSLEGLCKMLVMVPTGGHVLMLSGLKNFVRSGLHIKGLRAHDIDVKVDCPSSGSKPRIEIILHENIMVLGTC